jgi:choline dehydrogenase-like flavoprotein
MTETYDVIVIGSGAGGGTLVRHLAPGNPGQITEPD